jgi:hypothetical protein
MSAMEFFDYHLPVKSYSTVCDLHVKCRLKFFGGRDIPPLKNFFIDETPEKGTSLGQPASFGASCVQIG